MREPDCGSRIPEKWSMIPARLLSPARNYPGVPVYNRCIHDTVQLLQEVV